MKKLPLPDSEIYYLPNFIPAENTLDLFDILRQKIQWQQDEIRIFGKQIQQPRLTALYGENGRTYSYSGLTMNPLPFTSTLKEIKANIEAYALENFNVVLLNLYRNGQDSNGWHSDDEKELGKNPAIASLSLGEERWFHLRHKKNKSLKHKLILENGSLLLMKGSTQHFWQHQIPKTKREIGERINLTFRKIL